MALQRHGIELDDTVDPEDPLLLRFRDVIARYEEEGRQERRRETLLGVARMILGPTATSQLEDIEDVDELQRQVNALLRGRVGP